MTIRSRQKCSLQSQIASYDVATTYARLAVNSLDTPPPDLIIGTGLTEKMLREQAFIPWQSLATIFEHIEQRVQSPVWEVEFGARLNITAHGVLGFAALSAPTVGAAMTTLGTYHRARITAVAMHVLEQNERLEYTVTDVTGDVVFTHRIALIVLKVVESLLFEVCSDLPVDSITISLPTTRDADPQLIAESYRGKLRLGTKEYAIAIPMEQARRPSPLHDTVAHQDNLLECQRIIERGNLFANASSVVRYQMRRYLDARIAGHDVMERPPSLESLASQSAMSRRTLIRHLKYERTSYRAILDELRVEYAQRLLASNNLSISDVAWRLGYAESNSFERAFKRWHDMSPSAWRRTQAGAPES